MKDDPSQSESSHGGGARRAALAFIFITVVLDMLALGIVVPVLPKLVLSFEAGDSAHAATIYGVFGTVFAAMQFLCAPCSAPCRIALDAGRPSCFRTSGWGSIMS